MESVMQVTSEIRDNLKQKAASQKDEIAVMKAMLNDPTYQVGVYTKDGKIGDYCPYADSRKMMANVISTTTKISSQEAQELAASYECTRSDAQSFVNIGKEFVNTYLHTGRKLPLGGRKTMDAKLILRHVDERTKTVPTQNVDDNRKTTVVPQHDAVRAICSCPSWLK